MMSGVQECDQTPSIIYGYSVRRDVIYTRMCVWETKYRIPLAFLDQRNDQQPVHIQLILCRFNKMHVGAACTYLLTNVHVLESVHIQLLWWALEFWKVELQDVCDIFWHFIACKTKELCHVHVFGVFDASPSQKNRRHCGVSASTIAQVLSLLVVCQLHIYYFIESFFFLDFFGGVPVREIWTTPRARASRQKLCCSKCCNVQGETQTTTTLVNVGNELRCCISIFTAWSCTPLVFSPNVDHWFPFIASLLLVVFLLVLLEKVMRVFSWWTSLYFYILSKIIQIRDPIKIQLWWWLSTLSFERDICFNSNGGDYVY